MAVSLGVTAGMGAAMAAPALADTGEGSLGSNPISMSVGDQQIQFYNKTSESLVVVPNKQVWAATADLGVDVVSLFTAPALAKGGIAGIKAGTKLLANGAKVTWSAKSLYAAFGVVEEVEVIYNAATGNRSFTAYILPPGGRATVWDQDLMDTLGKPISGWGGAAGAHTVDIEVRTTSGRKLEFGSSPHDSWIATNEGIRRAGNSPVEPAFAASAMSWDDSKWRKPSAPPPRSSSIGGSELPDFRKFGYTNLAEAKMEAEKSADYYYEQFGSADSRMDPRASFLLQLYLQMHPELAHTPNFGGPDWNHYGRVTGPEKENSRTGEIWKWDPSSKTWKQTRDPMFDGPDWAASVVDESLQWTNTRTGEIYAFDKYKQAWRQLALPSSPNRDKRTSLSSVIMQDAGHIESPDGAKAPASPREAIAALPVAPPEPNSASTGSRQKRSAGHDATQPQPALSLTTASDPHQPVSPSRPQESSQQASPSDSVTGVTHAGAGAGGSAIPGGSNTGVSTTGGVDISGFSAETSTKDDTPAGGTVSGGTDTSGTSGGSATPGSTTAAAGGATTGSSGSVNAPTGATGETVGASDDVATGSTSTAGAAAGATSSAEAPLAGADQHGGQQAGGDVRQQITGPVADTVDPAKPSAGTAPHGLVQQAAQPGANTVMPASVVPGKSHDRQPTGQPLAQQHTSSAWSGKTDWRGLWDEPATTASAPPVATPTTDTEGRQTQTLLPQQSSIPTEAPAAAAPASITGTLAAAGGGTRTTDWADLFRGGSGTGTSASSAVDQTAQQQVRQRPVDQARQQSQLAVVQSQPVGYRQQAAAYQQPAEQSAYSGGDYSAGASGGSHYG